MTHVTRNVLAVAVGIAVGSAGGSALAVSKKTIDKSNVKEGGKSNVRDGGGKLPGNNEKMAGKSVTYVKGDLMDLFKSHRPDASLQALETISVAGDHGTKHYDVTENALRVVIGPTVSLHRYEIPVGALQNKSNAKVPRKSHYTVYSDKNENGDVLFKNTKFGLIPAVFFDNSTLETKFELGGFTINYDKKGDPFVVELFDSSGRLTVPGKYERKEGKHQSTPWEDGIGG